jgi:zinc transport system permease protein
MLGVPSACLFAEFAPAEWLNRAITACARHAPANSFFAFEWNIKALLALILVSFCCGAIGSLVIGSRMAFFSDALAHCSFAGISIGFLLFLLFGPSEKHDLETQRQFWDWVTFIMVVFGILAGCGIVWVRTRTGLSSDTVIGVFFAGAVGLAAALRDLIHNRALFNLEDFLFGSPLTVFSSHLLILGCLVVLTAVLLSWIYNHLLLAGFNQSLALSRRVPVQLVNYLFIILLALIVNLCLRFVGALLINALLIIPAATAVNLSRLCLRFVGALLINALLIIPAATAVNLSRNMRQLFWLTIILCFALSLGGQWLSWDLGMATPIKLGLSGTIVLLSVFAFLLSMLVGPWLRSRRAA